MVKRLARLLLLSALLALVAWLALDHYERRWLNEPIAALVEPELFEIAPGSSLTAVARRLEQRGLLEHAWLWIRHARRSGQSAVVQSGEFLLEPGATPASLLEQFVRGRVLLHAVTIPEGWTFREALAAIQAHPAIAAELQGLAAQEIARALGLGDRHPEGLFFPDTYRFPRGTSDRSLLRQMHERLQRELAAAWEQRVEDLPLATPYEALVLASIVEKETGQPDERPLIAGVFVNRLRRGMRLQTDPTVIYGLGERFDGNLRRADLQADTPYNTYTRAGLPPTPIALVGRAALEAAVRPQPTDALYFVATGLGDGRHYFSRTLAEHNAAVARHIANLRRGRGLGVR